MFFKFVAVVCMNSVICCCWFCSATNIDFNISCSYFLFALGTSYLYWLPVLDCSIWCAEIESMFFYVANTFCSILDIFFWIICKLLSILFFISDICCCRWWLIPASSCYVDGYDGAPWSYMFPNEGWWSANRCSTTAWSCSGAAPPYSCWFWICTSWLPNRGAES